MSLNLEAFADCYPWPEWVDSYGIKCVHADRTSSRGFRWTDGLVLAPEPLEPITYGDPCPQHPTDGVCVAKDWYGARSGGHDARVTLIVGWASTDVYGEDWSKVRVGRAWVADCWDIPLMARSGYLVGAYLRGADLRGAVLRGANLVGANLRRADLRGAVLVGAVLRGADLRGAVLEGADLRGANLERADLRGADLRGADLREADLREADLREADFPAGFTPPGSAIR